MTFRKLCSKLKTCFKDNNCVRFSYNSNNNSKFADENINIEDNDS